MEVETMPFTLPKEKYPGKVQEIKIGDLAIGGESTLPFLSFEGTVLQKPSIALEVQDVTPQDWPEALKKVYGNVWR